MVSIRNLPIVRQRLATEVPHQGVSRKLWQIHYLQISAHLASCTYVMHIDMSDQITRERHTIASFAYLLCAKSATLPNSIRDNVHSRSSHGPACYHTHLHSEQEDQCIAM